MHDRVVLTSRNPSQALWLGVIILWRSSVKGRSHCAADSRMRRAPSTA